MKDFLEKYHKHQQKTTGLIVAGALLMAVAFNFIALDNTNLAANIKSSVIDAGAKTEQADIYLQSREDGITLMNSKPINEAQSFSVSFSFNPEEIAIKKLSSEVGVVETLGDEQDGLITILLHIDNKTLKENSNIISIEYKKKTENSSQINIFNANFTDTTENIYELTTSGITL